VSAANARILDEVLAGKTPSWRELLPLADATGALLHELCATADELRRRQAGDLVTYVVNRNINFTNVCVKTCKFCAFSRNVRSDAGYFLDEAEIVRRALEARALGATEVCLQAGLAPGIDGMLYVDLVRAVKRAAPELHLHALSPEEVKYGAHRARLSVREFLTALLEAGLGTLPGTSAEILDDDIRARLAPGRITTAEWIEVVRTAHELGLRTTSTMMYGHLESPADRLRHMETLRDLQRDTGGFTEFVPLSFVHTEAPLFASEPGVRPGPGGLDVIRTHALARIALGADIPNLQVSWVKEGLRASEHLLACGVNDLGGTLMNESISTAAGATHGQLATPAALRGVARGAGRTPAERSTLYRILRVHAASAGGDDGGDALDGVTDAAATFGTYGDLTRSTRFRFRRRRGGDQLLEVGGMIDVEGEAVGAHDPDVEAVGGGGGEVARQAVGVAEASGHGCGQPQGERVGPELIAIRRHRDVGAL
jgi:7,8-didemethyl-8-hydroxy-5-deazariboflavin synthase CofH subunit